MSNFDRSFATSYENRDYWSIYGITEAFRSYGLRCDEFAKGKSLRKFGRTANADAGIKTTVATYQGAVVNETYAATNSVDSIVSDSASDTGLVTVEGHIVTDGKMSFIVQTANLNGTTPVALSTPLFRSDRTYRTPGTFASPATELQGNIAVYDSTEATGVTAGVPDVASATKAFIPAGRQQTYECRGSISNSDIFMITQVGCSINRSNQTSNVDFDIEYRPLGGVWLPIGLEMSLRTASNNSIYLPQGPYPIIPRNSDFRMVATSDTNDTTVTGHIYGILLSIEA